MRHSNAASRRQRSLARLDADRLERQSDAARRASARARADPHASCRRQGSRGEEAEGARVKLNHVDDAVRQRDLLADRPDSGDRVHVERQHVGRIGVDEPPNAVQRPIRHRPVAPAGALETAAHPSLRCIAPCDAGSRLLARVDAAKPIKQRVDAGSVERTRAKAAVARRADTQQTPLEGVPLERGLERVATLGDCISGSVRHIVDSETAVRRSSALQARWRQRRNDKG